MTDTTIESLLCHAPRPAAPQQLLNRLRADIVLPTKKVVAESREWQSPQRRWFPALAFGVVMLSCVILFAVQSNWSANLRRQNEALRTTVADLPQLREQHATLEAAQAKRDELAQLQKDNREVHQLQAEVATLRKLPGEIQRLQDENRRLATIPAAGPSAVNTAAFFEDAKQEAERAQCVNNLKQIGLAMRVWAGDNGDKYPTSLVVMSNEISATKVLVCPSDKQRLASIPPGWGNYLDNMTSYQFSVQPDDEQFPECITAYCPIHNNYLLADGSVQSVNPEKWRTIKRDGRLYLDQPNP